MNWRPPKQGYTWKDANQGNILKRLTPHSASLETNSETPGIFVTPYPVTGVPWQAKLDGKVVPTLTVFGSFVGLALPEGHHRIDLDYRSPYLPWGLRLRSLGIFLLACLYLVSRRGMRTLGWAPVLVAFLLTGAFHFTVERSLTMNSDRDLILNNNYKALISELHGL